MALWLNLSVRDWARLTPREVFALLDGAILRAGQRHEEVAWQTLHFLQPWSKRSLTFAEMLGNQPTVQHRLMARRKARRTRLGLPFEEEIT